MNEQNPYTASKERHIGKSQKGSTMEVVQLEKQSAPLPSWQRVVIAAFAIVGVLTLMAAIVVAMVGR